MPEIYVAQRLHSKWEDMEQNKHITKKHLWDNPSTTLK